MAGVCDCEKRHAAWWRGGVLPLMLVCGGLRCEAAGVVMGVAEAWLRGSGRLYSAGGECAAPLVLAGGSLCGKRDGGCWCAGAL